MTWIVTSKIGASRRVRTRLLRAPVAVAALLLSTSAAAIGTDAGRRIDSTAQATYDILRRHATRRQQQHRHRRRRRSARHGRRRCRTRDPCRSRAGRAARRCGSRSRTPATAPSRSGSRSTPPFPATISIRPSPLIYVESNGTTGLQIGAGGDTLYSLGANDPVLARDTSIAGYVTVDIPSALRRARWVASRCARCRKRCSSAAAPTIRRIRRFRRPALTYPGAGDPASGGGNVNAVVGNSHAPATLSLQAVGDLSRRPRRSSR